MQDPIDQVASWRALLPLLFVALVVGACLVMAMSASMTVAQRIAGCRVF